MNTINFECPFCGRKDVMERVTPISLDDVKVYALVHGWNLVEVKHNRYATECVECKLKDSRK